MNKTDKTKIIGILIIFGLLLITGAIFYFSVENIQMSGYFEAPFFGAIECAPAPGGYPVTTSNKLLVDKDGTYLVPPTNTLTYDLVIDYPKIGRLDWLRTVEYTECDDINGNGCGITRSKIMPIDLKNYDFDEYTIAQGFSAGKVLFVQTIGFASKPVSDGAKIGAKYLPYVLWNSNFLGGGINPVTGSEDCSIPTYSKEWRNAVISTDMSDNWIFYEGQKHLRPNDRYNYISGTITRATEGNTVIYNGKTGYCMDNVQGIGAVIYDISELNTSEVTYDIVDTNKPIVTLGAEGCCVENQIQLSRVCQDFYWRNIPEDEEDEFIPQCTRFINPCNPGRFELGEGTKTYELSCIDGVCQQVDIQEEECVSSSDCNGVNEICINFECMDASSPLVDPVEEPLECQWYQTEGTKKEWTYNVLGIRKSFDLVPTCKIAGWLLTIIIVGSFLGIIVVGLATFFVIKKIGTLK